MWSMNVELYITEIGSNKHKYGYSNQNYWYYSLKITQYELNTFCSYDYIDLNS